MEEIIQLQHATLASVLARRTASHWHDYPDFIPLIEPLRKMHDPPFNPALPYLLQLVQLAGQADEELSYESFLLLESYCVVAEPAVAAQALAHFMLEAGEPYPPLSATDQTTGWLKWSLDYKQELKRKGDMVRRLWNMAATRGENIQNLAIQLLVETLTRRQELEKGSDSVNKQDSDSDNKIRELNCTQIQAHHDTIYLLHCGPLSSLGLPLWDFESTLNALLRLRDGASSAAFENQMLILVNLLDRIFSWLESKEVEECIDQLKTRVEAYTRTPELFLFVMDAILKYLDGRWIGDDKNETEVLRPKAVKSTSLMEINRSREAIHYMPTSQQGVPGSFDGGPVSRGKPLKEREIRTSAGRDRHVREFELSDLVARCMSGHDSETVEQFVRRFILHLGMKVDTAMVSASSAALKHAAQQSTCKSKSPNFYPKELEETTWLAQLVEGTGLIPDPVHQAVVLFPLIECKDVGLLLEQCYYVLLIRNADVLQQPQVAGVKITLDSTGPEVFLIHRLIFKHAARTFHLMPLFTSTVSKPRLAEDVDQEPVQ
ncbi:hypothetical protein BGZ67_005753 [Mortierella alpina]|nr:hypothetical protein BGZ67_005753 [Mortierella alpina]